jgi:hypothetical protein
LYLLWFFAEDEGQYAESWFALVRAHQSGGLYVLDLQREQGGLCNIYNVTQSAAAVF